MSTLSASVATETIWDFARSFYVWALDLERKPPVTVTHTPPFTFNHVRVPLECRCHVERGDDGVPTEYILGAACKTERVNVPRDMWVQPNADFHPVASATRYFRIKGWDRCDKGVTREPPLTGVQPERYAGVADDTFALHRFELSDRPARVLESTDEIIRAAMTNRPLVARTEFDSPKFGRVTIEYPVKTINVSDRNGYYQVDTGPVLIPAMDGDNGKPPIEQLRLAYVAHNAPDWAEFLVNAPTPLTDDIRVNHYAHPIGVKAQNTMLEVLQ